MNLELANKTFSITGTLTMKREELAKQLAARGAKVTGAITKNTDFLLKGAKPNSGHLLRAKSLRVKVISEKAVVALLQTKQEGAKAAPKPTATVAKPTSAAAVKRELKALFDLAKSTKEGGMSPEQIGQLARLLPLANTDQRYQFSKHLDAAPRELMLPHASGLVAGLATMEHPYAYARLCAWLDADYTLEERLAIFRHAKDVGGHVLGKAGAVAVPELEKLWCTNDHRDRRGVLAAAMAMRGAAAPLAPLFEKAVADVIADPPTLVEYDVRAAIGYGSALALVAIDPSRASQLAPQLQIAMASGIVTDGATIRVKPGVLRAAVRDILERLPAAVQGKLADAVVALVGSTKKLDTAKLLLSLGDAGRARIAKMSKEWRERLSDTAKAEAR
jgi:hypothetical protein